MTELAPYEDTLTIEELRREVRECWDRQRAIAEALRDLPDMPSPWILLFLGRAAKWPEDNKIGKLLQRKMGLQIVPPKSECESGAGIWHRILHGMRKPREEIMAEYLAADVADKATKQ